ncbi:hypothetical protein [uncultured Sphaerochaeta sp.]|uniref:hypothetical protein n=1 Tax=uncultured Sphaerochaeta sp. TaxID=886478 RepID=UPI002A0A7F88|nr:hypothetical protein [uncultured Sphaerochaeta sp.]
MQQLKGYSCFSQFPMNILHISWFIDFFGNMLFFFADSIVWQVECLDRCLERDISFNDIPCS